MADNQKLQQIVERMVAAGESEQDIAAVIQLHKQSAPPAPQPEQKSLGGFLANIPSSLGRLLKDSATGAVDTTTWAAQASGLAGPRAQAAMSAKTGPVLQNAPQIAGAVGKAAKDRYGSLDAIGNTLYNDPAGAAADLSTVLSLGATATARAPRIAGALAKAAEATNPMRLVTAPAAKALNTTANLTVRGTLRPSKAIRDDFGGSKGVADAVLKERVYSEASAGRKLSKSVKQADDLLAEKQAAGVRGVPAKNVADAVVGPPLDSAMRRERLGAQNAVGSIADRRQRILDANQVPGQPNATRLIPLTEAQGLKREAQDLAYEARKAGLSLDAKADQSVAQALREGIEARVPEVGPINERSQRLIGTQRAFAEAQDRPERLTDLFSLSAAGGGAAVGDPLMGLLTAALIKGSRSPRAGAMAGIGLNEAGNFVNNPRIRQAALLARLAELPE